VDCGAPTGGVYCPLCPQCNNQLKSGAARIIILENGQRIRKPVDED
jgi:hypothetical protein